MDLDKYNTEQEIKDRIEEINKQLAYIRKRDKVSLAIGSEDEQYELNSEKAKLNGKLRKLRNKKVDIKNMSADEKEEFIKTLQHFDLLGDTYNEQDLERARQLYRAYFMDKDINKIDFEENLSLQDKTLKMIIESEKLQ